MTLRILAVATAALLAACSQPEEQSSAETPAPAAPAEATAQTASELSGFTHVEGEDLFGYYIPTQEVRIGDLKLDHLHIGGETEFQAWARGERSETYAPVMLEFSDLSSPTVTNELGQVVHTKTIRVLPSAYKLGEGDFRFVGSHPEIGEIRIDGMLDLDALNAARLDANIGAEEPQPVLRTAAQIGPEQLKTLSFFWFGGD